MTTVIPLGTQTAGSDLHGPARPVPAWRVRLGRAAAPLGLTPFALYVVLFLALPTVLAVTTGLFDKHGAFTWNNFTALGDPVILRTFGNSILLSLVSAAAGAIVGALVCIATLGLRDGGFARGLLESAASVIAVSNKAIACARTASVVAPG